MTGPDLSRYAPATRRSLAEWASKARAEIRKPKVIDRAAEAARKVTDTPLPEPEETL